MKILIKSEFDNFLPGIETSENGQYQYSVVMNTGIILLTLL
jgi:hypothetical protein